MLRFLTLFVEREDRCALQGLCFPFVSFCILLYSSSGIACAQAVPPLAPAGITALAGDGEISLHWSPTGSAISYTILGLTNGVTSAVATGLTYTTFTLRGLANNVSYSYRISASNAAGTSPASAIVSAKPLSGVAPVSAALLANEPFDGAAGPLLGSGLGAGWAAPWDVQNASSSVPGYALSTVNPLLFGTGTQSVSHLTGGYSYLTSGRRLDVSATGPFAAYVSNGLLATPGKTLWVSLLLRKNVNGNDLTYVSFHGGGLAWWIQTPLISVGYFGGDSNTGGVRYWSLSVGGVIRQTNTPVVTGQTALLVLGIEFGTNTSRASLYMNPTPANSAPLVPGATISTPLAVGFQSVAFYAGSDVNQSSLDELRFAADYTSIRTAVAVIPLPPAGLTALQADGRISLTWVPSVGATAYQVWAAINGSSVLVATVTGAAYVMTGLTNRTPVSFDVIPINSTGTGVATPAVVAVPRSALPTKAALGINLTGLADYGRSWPFVDAFKIARPWISQQQNGVWGQGGPLQLTPNGWIANLAPGQYAETILFDNAGDDAAASYPLGLYTLLYDGEGTIAFDYLSAAIVSHTVGRMVISVPAGQGIYLKLMQTNPANPMRNIRFIMPGFESSYAASPFHPLFLAGLKNFKAVRFMEWMATNNSTVRNWADRPHPTDFTYTWRGVPLELMIQLANTLHASPWLNMPHSATDDFVSRFASLVSAQLNPELKTYIEYSNENWNGQFTQMGYVQNQGVALGLNQDRTLAGIQYTALRSIQMFTLWQQAFGGITRLMRVLPAQAGNAWVAEQLLDFRNAASNADVLAIAPYFSVCSDVAIGGWDFLGLPSTQSQVAQLSANQVLDIEASHIQNCALSEIKSNAAIATAHGLKLVAYEGGQHLVGINGAENNTTLMALFKAANRSMRMQTLYSMYLQNWKDAGGDLFVSYSDVTGYSKWGNWGLK